MRCDHAKGLATVPDLELSATVSAAQQFQTGYTYNIPCAAIDIGRISGAGQQMTETSEVTVEPKIVSGSSLLEALACVAKKRKSRKKVRAKNRITTTSQRHFFLLQFEFCPFNMPVDVRKGRQRFFI